MKGLFLTIVLLVFATVQASAERRCSRGSKQVEQDLFRRRDRATAMRFSGADDLAGAPSSRRGIA
jgi:hypothetical protein